MDVYHPHCQALEYTSETPKLERVGSKYFDKMDRDSSKYRREPRRNKMAGSRRRFLGLPAWLLPSWWVVLVLAVSLVLVPLLRLVLFVARAAAS